MRSDTAVREGTMTLKIRSATALPVRELNKSLDLKPRVHKLKSAWRPSSLARFWGMSKQSIYRLIQANELKSITIAGAKRVTEESAVEFWNRNVSK